jgi:caffeoyl-CoA O-methyltransferase
VSAGVAPAIESYAEAHTTPFGSALDGDAPGRLGSPLMLSGPVVGRLLELLVHATRARLVLEVGTFAGVSALAMAAGLAPGGRIITCELDRERGEFARARFEEAGLGDRIELRLGPAIETIESLDGPFDLVFIDADKAGYLAYYEAVLPKLSPHGVIVVDNTLRSETALAAAHGASAAPQSMAHFNDHVASDPRAVSVMLTVRDGLTLIHRARPVGDH